MSATASPSDVQMFTVIRVQKTFPAGRASAMRVKLISALKPSIVSVRHSDPYTFIAAGQFSNEQLAAAMGPGYEFQVCEGQENLPFAIR